MDTAPLTAEAFTAVGVDATTAASLAQQHNTMAGRGSFNDRVALSNELESRAPAPKPTAVAPTSNAELVSAVTEHENATLAGQLDATFAPPAMAYEYKLEDESSLNDAQLAANSELKSAFHAAQLPKFVVDSIASNLATASRTLVNETPAQMNLRIESNKVRLQGMWGKEFDGNMSAVDTFLEQQGAKSPALKAFLANAAHAFTPLDIDLIFQVAKFRAGKR